jgi:hypothetical protein
MNITYPYPNNAYYLGMWLLVRNIDNGEWIGIESCLSQQEVYRIFRILVQHDHKNGHKSAYEYAIITNPRREPCSNDFVWLKPRRELYDFVKGK